MKNQAQPNEKVNGNMQLKKSSLITSPILLTAAVAIGVNKYRQTKKLKAYISKVKENTNHVKKAVILGDSVAKGYGSENGGITSYLKEHFENRFGEVMITNEGILHLTSEGLKQKLIDEKAYDHQLQNANLVFINIGGNDLLQHYHKDGPRAVLTNFFKVRSDYVKNLQQIIQHINELNPTITIVINNLYNSLEDNYQFFGLTSVFIDYWNASLNKLPVIRVNTKKLSRKEDLWADMVHPNQAGYKELSHLIIEKINTIIEK